MGAVFLGPRIGRYGPDGKPRAIPRHNIPFAMLGVFILWFGWFGFNPGSELAADEFVAGIAVNTLLAAGRRWRSACAAVVWMKSGKPDLAMIGNGVLAGTVSITGAVWRCHSGDVGHHRSRRRHHRRLRGQLLRQGAHRRSGWCHQRARRVRCLGCALDRLLRHVRRCPSSGVRMQGCSTAVASSNSSFRH